MSYCDISMQILTLMWHPNDDKLQITILGADISVQKKKEKQTKKTAVGERKETFSLNLFIKVNIFFTLFLTV